MSSEFLKVNIQASKNEISATDVAQLLYLLIDIRPPDEHIHERLPLNLCLVIDRSTSMRGERLNRVKAAASLVIDKLAPHDILSVVTFSDRADIVLPAGRVSNKTALMGRIQSIDASGATEIFQGLSTGIAQLKKAVSSKRISQLILLTDGHTYGDADACLQLAEQAVSQGIGFNAFGIGAEWNDQFLDKLVAPSGGQSAYIESPSQIVDYLQNRIHGLGDTYAQNLRLRTEFPVGVALRYSFKVTPFPQPLALGQYDVKLGAIEGHSPLSILLELAIEPQLPGKTIELPITIFSDIPAQQVQAHASNYTFKMRVVIEEPVIELPHSLVEAVRALNFYRMNEQVWQEVESGEIDMATMRLRRLTTRLLEEGHTQLAQQAYAETERLATIGTLSLEGRKKLKYGTRSLMTQTIKLDAS